MSEGPVEIPFDGEEPERLRPFLLRRVPGLSRRAVTRAIEAGQVLVNGRPARPVRRLRRGDRISIEPNWLASDAPRPEPEARLDVLYEDPWLVAVLKPTGRPVHPLRPGEGGTVANALVARFPETAGAGRVPREAGLLHRLDVETSGVLLAARDPGTFRRMWRALRSHATMKTYAAIVRGRLDRSLRIRLPLAVSSRRSARVVALKPGVAAARFRRVLPATTRVRPIRIAGSDTAVVATIHRGGRHQIRAHLAAVGHPIAGDRMYGDPDAAAAPRLLLHAWRIRFRHPVTGRIVRVRADIAEDLYCP